VSGFNPASARALTFFGVAVAATHDYFKHVDGWRGVLSAIFAVFLWPLILLGIDLHVKK
jgi:hypothetical protein